MSEKSEILGLAFVSVYTDDFEKSYKFYHEVLGLQKEFDMGNQACFFGIGPENHTGLYLQGGNERIEFKADSMRAAFVLSVHSAFKMYEKLVALDIKMMQEEPIDMGQGDFWFQCYDPCGNILEFLGGK
ncbi:MAG: VOC family protein [Candidatus Cloacimonetes bacterium]|nr:VOC family protein [Candidatus Cloacimonadota bacterium]